jgi:hypothetical protein
MQFASSAIFFCLYWFTNSAIFFLSLLVYKQGFIFSKEKKKKIIALFVKWNLISFFVEFKVGGVIFDWLKLLQESKV